MINSSISVVTTPTSTSIEPPNYSLYFRVELACAICFALFSPITVACNTLLLVTIYKDPFKSFRIPPTYFVAALAVVDLLVGLVVEPIFSIFFFVRYFKKSGTVYPILGQVAGFLSTVLLTSSFLLVLALTITQYIAITHPHKYKSIVKTRRVLIFIGLTWLYFILFSALPFTGIPRMVYYNIDLFFHTILISLLLVIAHICLYRSFRSFVKQSQALQNQITLTRNHDTADQEKRENKKNFTTATLLLSALLVFSALPHIIAFCFFLYTRPETAEEDIRINIALRISDIVIFLKVAFNTFIYAWRLPRYRRALKNTLMCAGIQVEENNRRQNGPNSA